MRDGSILGVTAAVGGAPQLAIVSDRGAVSIVSLPELASISRLAPSPAASRHGGGPVRAFLGRLPGGGPNGEKTIFVGGGLLTSIGELATTATLAGTAPIGLAGPARGWLVLWHRPSPGLDPAGGRLDPPVVEAGSGVSVVRSDAILSPELDDGRLEPALDGAIIEDGDLLVSGDGFGVTIEAPPGTRVHYRGGSGERPHVEVVPPTGRLRVAARPVPEDPEEPTRVAIAVVTPGGHAYVADWNVAVFAGPPALDVTVETTAGSPSVLIDGRTAPLHRVRIGDRDASVDAEGRFSTRIELPPWPTEIEVVAIDLVGNESRLVVVGIGWFDYRTLPWTAIVIAAVAVAGGFLALRAPRARGAARTADDDGSLEELDPDG